MRKVAKQKHEGKIVCGSFSGDPKKYPAWNDNMEIVIDRGTLIATPATAARPGHGRHGGPSGAVLMAGEGGLPGQPPEWTYEFAGKLNPKGPTVLRGQLGQHHGRRRQALLLDIVLSRRARPARSARFLTLSSSEARRT